MGTVQTQTKKRIVRLALATAALVGTGSFAMSVQAAVVQPCETAAALAISVLPINGGGQTYCQSAYGWSDTWFAASQPAVYDQHLDVLSGDNAPSFFYKTAAGGIVGSGNQYNFISPYLDGGTLNATLIGSNWTVVNDITVVGNVGTSKIQLPGAGQGVTADIVTTVGASGITEKFTFTNLTGIRIEEIWFDDYFNFHANGSDGSDVACPTTEYKVGVVTTTGKTGGGCSPIVKNGSMYGSATEGGTVVLPTKYDLGGATSVLANIAANTYTGGVSYTGDGAADLLWNLGPLEDGTSVSFVINKNFERIPEPATLALFSAGLFGLRLFRRRTAV